MSPSVSDQITVVDPVTPVRRCGRCRKEFPGEVDAVAGGPLPEWWACTECRVKLFGPVAPAVASAPPSSRPAGG